MVHFLPSRRNRKNAQNSNTKFWQSSCPSKIYVWEIPTSNMAPGVGCSVTFSRQGIWPLPARRGNFHQLRQIYFLNLRIIFYKTKSYEIPCILFVLTSPATGRKYEEEVGPTTLARSSSESPAVSVWAALLVFISMERCCKEGSFEPAPPWTICIRKQEIQNQVFYLLNGVKNQQGNEANDNSLPFVKKKGKILKVPEVFKLKYLKLTDHL